MIEYWTKEGRFECKLWLELSYSDLHRLDGPAVTKADGTKMWFLDGKRHREDGPAIIYSDGSQEWYLNGKLHRTDGPAVIRPGGTQEWYLDGKRHRTDGPAIIYSDVSQEWWLWDDKLIQADHFKQSPYFQDMTPEQQVLERLKIR